MMYGLYNNDFGWDRVDMMGFFGGGIIMILFWALIIACIIWVVRQVSGGYHHCSHPHGDSHSHALDILKERYAKGEINKEEFESKKKDIIG
jgi:putative membrane protein